MTHLVRIAAVGCFGIMFLLAIGAIVVVTIEAVKQ